MLKIKRAALSNSAIHKVRKLTFSGLVVALYVVIMYFTQAFAFGQYQIRIATSLYALSAIFPFLIVPLAFANLLSNTLMGGLGLLDMAGGFFVGILTSCCCYYLRKISVLLIAVPIIFIPALVVPLWLSHLIQVPYGLLVISIGAGQILPSFVGILIVKRFEYTLALIQEGRQNDRKSHDN